MQPGGFLGEPGRFPGKEGGVGTAQPPPPAGTNLQWLVGKAAGSIFPLGLSVARICSAEATGETEAAVPIPLSLIHTLGLSALFKKTQKTPEIQCSLDLSSPRLPEMRRSHTISRTLFSGLIPVSHL